MIVNECNPYFSVIVPVYNVEQYLTQCVDSVISQTYSNFELILVDDGSTDTSGAMCDFIATQDKRVKVYHKINGGLSSARNYGIKECIGRYVIFLDSDDFWVDLNFLEKAYVKSNQHEYDLIRLEYVKVDYMGNLIETPDLSDKEHFQELTLGSYEMMENIMRGEYFSWLFIFRRELFSKIIFNEQVKFQEDIDFAIRLFTNHLNCGYLPIHFYAYRQREHSIMSTPKVDNLYSSFSFCDLLHRCSSNVADKRLREVYIYNGILMYCWTIRNVASDFYYCRYHDIDKVVGLNQLRKRMLTYKTRISKHRYPISLYLPPYIFVTLLRIKQKMFT